jgi:uncharacterized membrane protein HdeD (DUF308 family)
VRGAYRSTTLVFGVVAIALGIALVARTAADGGGVGLLVGALFVAVGAGRIYLLRRR